MQAGKMIRDQRGEVLIEMALGMAILLPMLLMGVELGRFLILQQKLERMTVTMGDLATRSDVVSAVQRTDILAAAPAMAAPFDFSLHGAVVLSGVSAAGGNGSTPPIVVWQQRSGNNVIPSRIGQADGPGALPSGMVLTGGDTVVVAEVFYDYQPVLLSLIQARTLYDRVVLRPRGGS